MFLWLNNQGLLHIYFGDEVGFSCTPNIPYSWSKKGAQIEFPSSKKMALKVLGLLNPITDHLITYSLGEKEKMDSALFCKFMDDFSRQNNELKVLILDNASYHKSALTKSHFRQWESRGLFIFFLPPRCPHLNLIETLWRKIKYEWLSVKDYYSDKTLKKKVRHILKSYGDSDYNIEFSMNIFKTRFNW